MWDMFLVPSKGHHLPVDSIKQVGGAFLGVREVPHSETVIGVYLQHRQTRQRQEVQHFPCVVHCRRRDTLKAICRRN